MILLGWKSEAFFYENGNFAGFRDINDRTGIGTNIINVTKKSKDSQIDVDISNLVFAVFGFFISLVGLILYLIYEDKKPQRAKTAGKGALIGFIIKGVLVIILVIFYITTMVNLFNRI